MNRGLLVGGSAAVIAAGIAIYIVRIQGSTPRHPPPVAAIPHDPQDANERAPTPMPTPLKVVTEAVVDPVRRAEIAKALSDAREKGRPSASLTKNDVRGGIRALVPMLTDCYERAQVRDPQIGGVVNPKLTLDSEPGQGTIVTVRGFDTAGALGRSSEFRDCVSATLETIVLPPMGHGGSLEVVYPLTFAPQPPDNRQTELVDQAKTEAANGQWQKALIDAERGLEVISIDGTFRRQLIEVAGLAACQLKDDAKARHYFALASASVEPALRETCLRVAQIDLTR